MAAILKLRRGISTPTLVESELFFNQNDTTIIVGTTLTPITLVKIGENTGSISFTGDITASNLSLSGNANIDGNITLGGSIYLGDGDSTDEIIVNASLSGSLVPDTDAVYDLGSTSFRYNNLYVVSASIENISLPGSNIVSSSQQITDYNIFLEINGDNVVSGSSQINVNNTQNFTPFSSSVDTKFGILNTYTSSTDLRLTSIETETGSIETDQGIQDDRLDNIEIVTASLSTTFEEIASSTHTLVSGSTQITNGSTILSSSNENFTIFSSSVDTRLDEVESTSSLNETNITELFSTASDHEDRVVELEVTGSDHEGRIDLLESFSSSLDDTFVTETELNNATSSLSASLTETDIDFEGRIDTLETTFSSSVDSRLDAQESFSESLDNTFLNTNGDSVVSGSDQVTASLDLRYLEINGDSVVSGSDQVTASLDLLYEEIASATHTLISGSTQFTDGSGILSSSNENFTTFSSSIDGRVDTIETTFSTSVDSRLDEIETTFSTSVDDQLTQIHAYTSSLKTSIDVSGTDLIVLGNLTVQGTQTSLNTTETFIEDKTLTIASGSTTSAEADGAGLIIDGANKSITWNHTDQLFELNGKVSSSVGFKGDGSELENVTAGDVEYINVLNKPTLVSGSSQISFTGITDKPTLFSGSSQVNADTITNFDSNVKDKMNLDNVISGSSQILDGSGLLSSSNENFTTFSSSVDTRLDGIETTFSTSVDSRLDFIEGTFSSSVDSRLDAQELFSASLDNEFLNTNGDSVVSGSDQVTQSLDLRYEEIGSSTHTLVSGSSQVDYNSILNQPTTITTEQANKITSNNSKVGYTDELVKTKLNLETVISGSSQVDYNSIQNQPTTITTQQSSDITSNNSKVGYTDTLVKTKLDLDGVISSSVQVNADSITNFDNNVKTKLDLDNVVSGSIYSSDNQGILTASINGIETTTDLGLSITSEPTFDGLSLTSLDVDASQNEFTTLLLSSSNEITQAELGSAAFYHVSNSIDDGNPLVLGNAGAVKSYVDEKIIAASSGDITEVNAGDGLSGGSTVGAATLTLDTGSQHFINGVTDIATTLPDGLISGSDQVTQSLDSRYVNVSGDTISGDIIISGDLTVNGTTTTINTTNLNVEDNIIELNYGGSATNGGILVKDINGTTTSGSLLWDGTNDYWIAGPLGSEARILTTTDNVITNSNIDSKIKLKLDNDNVHSGSYLGTATTSDLDEGSGLYYTDLRVKTKLDNDGVISGSIQITNNSGILSSSNENFTDFSSSVDGRFGALSTDYNDLQNVPSGIVSSSTQISNYNTFLEINGDSVISGSSQVQIDSVSGFTSFSSSVDTRIDSLESFSSSLDAGFVTETELNTATQSLQDSIDLKLDTTSYTTDSSSFDNRIDSLEGVTSENPLTFSDTSTIDFTRAGDTITADVIGGVVSGSSQIDIHSTDGYVANEHIDHSSITIGSGKGLSGGGTIETSRSISLDSGSVHFSEGVKKRLDAETIISGSVQVDVTQTTNYSSINQYSDSKVKLKLDADGVISGSSQITNGSGILSSSNEDFTTFSSSVDTRIDSLDGDIHTHSNKANLDTINQNLSTTSDVVFNDIQINGTGSFGSDVTIYGDLTVLGTETIINTTNLAIEDNMIYLNSGSGDTNVDLGWAGNYNDGTYAHAGIFRDASDGGIFKFYDGYTPEPGANIDTTHASFNLADIQVNTGSLNRIELTSGSLSRSYITYDSVAGTAIVSDTSISLLTAGGGDGVVIASNGNTTIYGALALQDIATSTSTTVLVNGGSNVVAQRTLGSNAFNSNSYLRSDTTDTASGIITFSNTTQSTSNTTGGVIVSGGVGIAKTLNVGEDVVAYASSDRRLKDNILPIQNPLQKINSIGGYSFDWNVEKQDIYKGKDYGVIAQEIEEILPELVDTRENGYKAVKYDKLVSLLIEGIKELSSEVEQLKQQINK